MAKKIPAMSDSKIRSLRHKLVNEVPTKATHFVGLVDGLALICKPPMLDEEGKPKTKFGSRSWCLFYRIEGQKNPNQPKTKGLGGYPSTSTAEAVRKAQEWRSLLSQGIDPREEEQEKARQLKRKQKYQIPFSVAAQNWCDFQIARPNVSAPDYQKKFNAVQKHMFPILGKRPIGDIEYEEGLKALRTIWEEKPPTAWKIQGAMKQIFDRAGLKDELNIFQWKDNLANDLPHIDEIHTTKNQPALDYNEMYWFVQKLMQVESVGAKALLLHILTVGRDETICLAEWNQFDFKKKVWNRPAEIMKGVRIKGHTVKQPHTQPLADWTVDWLQSIKGKGLAGGSISEEGLIFRAAKGGRIYDPHLSDLIPQLGYRRDEVTPHGFRSSFKDWCLEQSNYPELVTEKCLAHKIGDEVRNSYARTEFIDKRRPVMEQWCNWCFTEPRKEDEEKIVSINEKRAGR